MHYDKIYTFKICALFMNYNINFMINHSALVILGDWSSAFNGKENLAIDGRVVQEKTVFMFDDGGRESTWSYYGK